MQKKAMLRESDVQEKARIILHRRIFHSSKRVPPLKNKAAALAPRFDFFCGSTFCPLLSDYAISHRSMLAC